MEGILKELIDSYSEKRVKPKEFKFYSNLSITQPIKTHTDISTSISKGISFLEKSLNPKSGFQSRPFSDKNCNTPFISENPIPPEIYTNLLALDLLCDEGEDGESEIKINKKALDTVRNYILPESGISTFNIFKPSPSSTSNTNFESEESSDEIESNASSSVDSSYSSMTMHHQLIPDDCNTTSLALAVLLNEEILETRPAGSITEILLSNVPINNATNNSVDYPTNYHPYEHQPPQQLLPELKNYSGVPRTFLTCEGIDIVTCANILYIYYLIDYVSLNFEEYVETTEIFLEQTLKSFLTREEEDLPENNNHVLHHSLDAFIYFLSRVTCISEHARDRFAHLLITLLDQRIGETDQTSRPLDLAMRILAADHLGLLTDQGNPMMHSRVARDYEALAMLQNEVDGSWPADSIFKIDIGYGKDVFFGGEEISTIFACKALDVYYESIKAVKVKTRLYKDFVY